MFAGIARRYDLANRFISLGKDRYWRREAAALAAPDRICTEPWTTLFVTWDGVVRPCCYSGVAVARLSEHPVDEIWNGPVYRELREANHELIGGFSAFLPGGQVGARVEPGLVTQKDRESCDPHDEEDKHRAAPEEKPFSTHDRTRERGKSPKRRGL